jgi:hypothetical protein
VSVTEITTLIDGVREISRTERKLFTLAELKEGDDSTAFDRACSWLIERTMEWDWWSTSLECEVDYIKEKYGFTYNPKDVSFDLDRGDYFCFGKTTELKERIFLKRAGIDLRTKAARAIIEDEQLVIGVRYGYGEHNWIGYASYEYIPEYIEEMSPGISDKLMDTLRDAQHEMLKNLRAEQDYLTSEEYLLEYANNEYEELWFDAHGYHAT